MNAILTITEPNGRVFEYGIVPGRQFTIGRAKENDIVLNDRRVSRRHAYIDSSTGYRLVDGYFEEGRLVRSVNHVFVNGAASVEAQLADGDEITIGESKLRFRFVGLERKPDPVPEPVPYPSAVPQPAIHFAAQPATAFRTDETQAASAPVGIRYDDAPLGHTMMEISAREIIGRQSHLSVETTPATAEEIKALRRKARNLELLYEMSKTLGRVFDLEAIFDKATELIFRGTPADRVVALLADETPDGKILEYSLVQVGAKVRDMSVAQSSEKLTVSRTITNKVMSEKVAILSQDARTDEMFRGAESIVAQGVRSTICAPLITESNVHGVLYADRLDPFAAFSPDHLELISAVAAQTAVTVETVKSHKRLAREEVARANYGRFMPEYVVRQLLNDPQSFRLGGVNQLVTVLFADIRGFTALSEREKPERIVNLLNRYFSAMSEVIFAHGGTLDKYIGDGLMALFGAPTATPVDAVNAVKAAVAMQKRTILLNSETQAEGFPPISIGIGLHTGEATVGYIGSDKRSEYTAIGDTVNLAARLESNSTGGQILLSHASAAAAGGVFPVIQREPLIVKNRVQPVELFELKWS
ncbi:MAG: FHA domain-containing protein [Acidobacteria bacterium]|nr:FHA domain-containing protein [Acidobacteriota bacterium]